MKVKLKALPLASNKAKFKKTNKPFVTDKPDTTKFNQEGEVVT